jgi:hypothetical protein
MPSKEYHNKLLAMINQNDELCRIAKTLDLVNTRDLVSTIVTISESVTQLDGVDFTAMEAWMGHISTTIRCLKEKDNE